MLTTTVTIVFLLVASALVALAVHELLGSGRGGNQEAANAAAAQVAAMEPVFENLDHAVVGLQQQQTALATELEVRVRSMTREGAAHEAAIAAAFHESRSSNADLRGEIEAMGRVVAELSAQVVSSTRSCSETVRIDKMEEVLTEFASRPDGSAALEKLEQSFFAQDMRLCTLEDSFGEAEGALNAIRDSQRAAKEAERRDLTRIKGIGATLAKTLNEAGIESLDQVASLSIDQIETLSEKLGTFASRIERDQWIEQARTLVS